jgi:CDP-diacylglycerol pyrophosphatase
MKRAWCMLAVAAILTAGFTSTRGAPVQAPHSNDRNALWRKVHDICAVKARERVFPPTPCAEVHEGRNGYAVFKDQHGAYQYLLIPILRISGIESPSLLAPNASNYFASAWNARRYVEQALGARQPRDVFSFVVNSQEGRSQDQLHIHIDCVRQDVHDAIAKWLPAIKEQWSWLPQRLPPDGHRYMARRLNGESLSINPVQDLRRGLSSEDHLSQHSLVVIGMTDPVAGPGFVLLSGRTDEVEGDHGNAEDLQDLDCSMARHATHL